MHSTSIKKINPAYIERSHSYHIIRSIPRSSQDFREKRKFLLSGLESFSKREVLRYSNSPRNFEDFRKNENIDFSDFLVEKRYGIDWIEAGRGYMDSAYGFLFKNGKFNVGIASFEGVRSSLLMTQIQGFSGAKDSLRGINLPKFFINLFENFGREVGIPTISILPYSRNSYSKVKEDSRKRMSYDVPARQMGFHFDEDKGVYIKELE